MGKLTQRPPEIFKLFSIKAKVRKMVRVPRNCKSFCDHIDIKLGKPKIK